MNHPPHKPSFKHLCVLYGVKPEVLARESHIRPIIALALVNGYGTSLETAQAALGGLNRITGTHYQLSDIRIELHERKN